MLKTDHLVAYYGDFQALYGISVEVKAGEVVSIIGANGAGKSTFLKCLTGLMPARPDSIWFDGQPMGGKSPHQIVQLGIAMVPEGRRIFSSLTVEENLLVGGHVNRPGYWNLDTVYTLFPALAEKRTTLGNRLSGGQQQMVAIGRALMSNPRLLLFDEISLGLAPLIIKDIYAALPQIRHQGITVLLVEQDTNQALKVADQVHCFREGRLVLSGAAADLSYDAISAAYFGLRDTIHDLG